MIHFKNHKRGFTLIEVIISLAITGTVLTPVFMMHEIILNLVSRSSRAFDYLLLCQNLLYEARQKQEPDAQQFLLDKTNVEFDATLTYSLEKGVDQKSSLASLQGLHKEQVTVFWTELDKKKQERLVTFVYKKPEQKKSS
ncbi:MAG TPA: prepilin-type N-terminal cleavage/methylation domain-containing protein [Candidatus Babeliales bacterium]|jgi:prepilin-type N-terminal cleavage/methylation domain-containing protein|nr:prepilin-type N-terminal cleavage/methylation domain-containing protein [Candidatus Babeliales bacterium]